MSDTTLAQLNRLYPKVFCNGLILFLLALTGSGAALAVDGPSVLVKTRSVLVQNIAESLPTFGRVEVDPEFLQVLSLPNGGYIDKVWINTGQRVSQGDELIRVIVDPELHRQYEQAKVELQTTDQELARLKRLHDKQLSSNADVRRAQANRDNANETLVALDARGLSRTETILRSPVNGIITSLAIRQGDRVAPETVTAMIAPIEHLIARLGIAPENASRLSAGMPISLKPVFGTAAPIDAKINEVHGMIDPTTNLVEVLVDLPFDPTMVLGIRIIGQIHLPAHEALVVPRSAVLGDESRHHVFTIEDGRARRVSVTTGIESGNLLEVSGGIAAGDKVVVLGNYELEDGMAVREDNP